MTEKRIIEITKIDGYKVHCLYEDGEPRTIDFKQFFKDWVKKEDIAYPLTQSLSEFQKIKLENDNTFVWQQMKSVTEVTNRHTMNFHYSFCVKYEATTADDVNEHLGYLIEEFANEVIDYCHPKNGQEQYKNIFLLLTYISQEARGFFGIHSKNEKFFRSFELPYHYILEQFGHPKEGKIMASVTALKDKMIKCTLDKYASYYMNTVKNYDNFYVFKPIYVQGIKKAIEHPQVNDLFRKILLLLGEKKACEKCTYEGHFLHGYKCLCNELYTSGKICPQCHSWSDLGTVLCGITQPYALSSLYKASNLIKYISFNIGEQTIKTGVPAGPAQSLSYTKLKTIIAEIINNDICYKEVILPSSFELDIKNGEMENEALKLDTTTEITFELNINDTAPVSLAKLESIILQDSTDIDW